jgi:hypothetical protein
MTRGSKLLITAVIAVFLATAGPAQAFPRKSVLTGAGWNCFKRDMTYFLLSLSMDDHYTRSQPLGGNGNYRYNRDAGKVNFRSGPLEDFFGKLSQGLGGWDMTIKRDSNGNRWGDCSNYTAGG